MQDPAFVHEAFAKISGRYVATNHVLSLGTDILWRRKVARLVREMKPASLLDLATGSGDLAMEIAKLNPQTKIIGADFCEPMLEVARQRKVPGVEWIVADAMNLAMPDATFDVVTVENASAGGRYRAVAWTQQQELPPLRGESVWLVRPCHILKRLR